VLTRRLLGLVALLCIAVQFRGSLLLSLAALVLWIGTLAILDRGSLRRMWMPRFWLITIVVALGSGMLLGQREAGLFGLPLSRSGLEAGMLMVLRGAFIFGIAAWASRAMDEELVARAAKALGVEPLGWAIPVALKLLPELQTRLLRAAAATRETTSRWRLLGRSYEISVELICQTAGLAGQITKASTGRTIVGVIGGRGAGKTTALSELALLLERRGLEVGGVVQPAVHQYPAAARVGYLLRDLHDGEDRIFARRREGVSSGFHFDQSGWEWARRRILDARISMDVVVVDELGRLEAEGGGHLPGLEAPLDADRARLWLLGVRADQSEIFERRLGPFALTLRLDGGKTTDAIGSLTEQIEELLENK
jgi:nucleoside-triphosphatase THEP1